MTADPSEKPVSTAAAFTLKSVFVRPVAALFALDDTVLTAWFTTGAAVVGRNRRAHASAYC
jgi:hypothetical protein